ncbi:helix-turn-helix transcriptional regulator [Dyadobacter psychrotolerans]|uniref:Helix-turn-helix domain-containing protein n=1 Tax=Dyadobacter psychrotolerans TaxID=2541721 RepID=A0A4R5DYH1_9BACT|nr:helix-turn-helix transcriptional regulator [Dyadobacter psychrotolerans]TDE17540.1 helix-turn-helix domain-containing protein [Dyadobacter psychrotolerans]
MSIVSNNIKYLRRLNGLTQEQFARKIAIKRSLLGAYEEARANPNLTNLKNMAAAFGISVDNLLKNDLRKLRETPDMSLPLNASRQMTVSHSGSTSAPAPARMPTYAEPQPLSKIVEKFQQPKQEIRMVSRQVNLKPVSGEAPLPAATAQPTVQKSAPNNPYATSNVQSNSYPTQQLPVFNNQYEGSALTHRPNVPATNYPTIQWVAQNQSKEYLAHYQNPAFLTQLPLFQLPNLPSGYYRAFESGADFIYPGSLLVGTFVRNWYEIQNGSPYIFVLRNQGFLYRRAFNQVKEKGLLLLNSDISGIPDIQIPLHDVLEVWDIKAFVSLRMPAPMPSIERMGQLVDEMYKELNQLG